MEKLKLSTFLSNFPLYKPFKLTEADGPDLSLVEPRAILNSTFRYVCDKENTQTTFKLIPSYYAATELNRFSSIGIDDSDFLDKDRILEYFIPLSAKCQSCGEFNLEFLFRIWSDNRIPVAIKRSSSGIGSTYESIAHTPLETTSIFIEKVGIHPPINVQLNKDVVKFFDRESHSWYYKGSKAISEGYGIGAFAYFRRLIEKELLHIVRDLSELPSSDSQKIQKLITEYEASSKIYLIYDNVYDLLPKSLHLLGENPLKFLYQQASEGLHTLTDETCLEKAEAINMVLTFVILKIYEEKSELANIRETIKHLKKI